MFEDTNKNYDEIKYKKKLIETYDIDPSKVEGVISSLRQLGDIEERLSSITAQAEAIKKEIDASNERRIAIEQELIDLNNEAIDAATKKEEAETNFIVKNEDATAALLKHGDASAEYAQAMDDLYAAQRELIDATKELTEKEEELEDKRKEQTNNSNEIKNLTKQEESINKNGERLKQNKQILGRDLSIKTNGQLNENSSEITTLKQRTNQQQEDASTRSAQQAQIAKISKIVDGIKQVAEAYLEYSMAEKQKELINFSAAQKAAMSDLTTNTKIFSNTIAVGSANISKSLSSSFSAFKGVSESLSSSANSMMDLTIDNFNKQLENDLLILKNTNRKEIIERERTIKNYEQTSKQIDAGFKAAAGAAAAVMAATGVGLVAAAGVGLTIGLVQGITSIYRKIQEAENTVEIEKLKQQKELREEQLKSLQEAQKSILQAAKDAVKPILELSGQISDYSLKAEHAFKKSAVSLGMIGDEAEDYTKKMFDTSKKLYITDKKGERTFLNQTPEQRGKIQEAYNNNTGFAIELNEDDFKKSFIMGNFWGDENIESLTASMQIFNHSVDSSSEMFFEMYDTARKLGISQQKYAKDLVKNLKLAEKYQFKGGTKGLMEMAAWAQKVRFNMDNFDAALEKIQSGGIEGAITMGAQLQVLGGNVAMYADPLAMMWESYNDPKAYAERISNMLKGFGSFNAKTGEVDFDMQDKMMLQSIASATGQNVEDLMNQRRQGIKDEKIRHLITNSNYSEEQKNLIISKATLGEDGQWKVNGKDINTLDDSDFNALLPLEQGMYNNVEKIAEILSRKQKAEGVTNYGAALTADFNFDAWVNQMDEATKENLRYFDSNQELFKSMINKAYEYNLESLKQSHQQMEQSEEVVQNSFALLIKEQKNAIEALTGASGSVSEGIKALNQGLSSFKKYLIKQGFELGSDDDRVDTIRTALSMASAHEIEKVKKLKAGSDVSGDLYNDITGRDWKSARDDWFASLPKELQQMARSDRKEKREAFQKLLIEAKKAEGLGDGIVTSNGTPMLTAASKVTPIHDGATQLAESDPKDMAIFAKIGGPFHTLFNDIFGKIIEIWTAIKPKPTDILMPSAPFNVNINNTQENKSANTNTNTFKIEINGKLDLAGENGQNINIIEQLSNNTTLVRALTELLAESISKNINGGRSVMSGVNGIPRYVGQNY